MTDRYLIPIRTYSTLNQRVHWAVRAKRTKAEREAVRACCLGIKPLRGSAVVTLVRVAPRGLDDDNLAASFKACRDQLALMLGLPDDRDPRVVWRYGQRRGAVREYGIDIVVERRVEVAA